jgi:hypothetical protein
MNNLSIIKIINTFIEENIILFLSFSKLELIIKFFNKLNLAYIV